MLLGGNDVVREEKSSDEDDDSQYKSRSKNSLEGRAPGRSAAITDFDDFNDKKGKPVKVVFDHTNDKGKAVTHQIEIDDVMQVQDITQFI